MRIFGLALFVGCIVLMSQSVFSEQLSIKDPIYVDIEMNTLKPFFEALKQGDITSIKKFTAGELYKNNKILLEQNKEYPKFLREYYNGAKFQIEKAEILENDIIVDVVIEFQNGSQIHDRWRLSKQKSTDPTFSENVTWKIVETNIKP